MRADSGCLCRHFLNFSRRADASPVAAATAALDSANCALSFATWLDPPDFALAFPPLFFLALCPPSALLLDDELDDEDEVEGRAVRLLDLAFALGFTVGSASPSSRGQSHTHTHAERTTENDDT